MNLKTQAGDSLVHGAEAITLSCPDGSWAPRILVVDDEESARYLDCRKLSRAGYIVDTAADGEEAWSALCSAPYDLVLSDQQMPKLCGLELVARMRAAGMTLPVIIHSGCIGVGEPADYPHLKLAAVLHKQLNSNTLLETVGRLVPPPSLSTKTFHP